MKKKAKFISSNFISNQNQKYNNSNNIKSTTNSINRVQKVNDNISNHFIKRFHKNDKLKFHQISSSSNFSNLNSNTVSSYSIPYNYILDDLLKYLENKVNPQLYEDLNKYLNTKISNYCSESIENTDNTMTKNAKNDLNKNNTKKKKIKINAFSDKKYKSYMHFNILTKNKTKNETNNYFNPKKNIKNMKLIKTNNIKKDNKKDNVSSKLIISNDCLKKKINLIGSKKRKNISDDINVFGNGYFGSVNLNHKPNQDSHISFKRYYNGSSENVKNVTYENNIQKNKIKSNINNEPNGMEKIKIYKKINPANKNKVKLNRKNIENILGDYKPKSLFQFERNNINFTSNKNEQKSNSIRNNNKVNKLKLKLNVTSKNNEKSYNFNQERNHQEDKSNTNSSLQNKNYTMNVNLNRNNFLNEKLINSLKRNLNEYNRFFNSINKPKNRPYNLKNYSIFTKLSKNISNNINTNSTLVNNTTLTNKTANDKYIKKSYMSNIKKAKSYRYNNSNNKKTILSLRKKSIGMLKEKNKVLKLDKNNFLNIVNNITNKKNINDKKYIHINSIEINNIIKSNENKNENNDSKENNNGIQINLTNEEMMKKIKNSIDDNLKVMLNFSYENFLSKESERESKDLIQ